jgi:Rrf2 family protein
VKKGMVIHMRISAKGRYALAATTSMAQSYNKDEYITLISISDKLDISKIYLEQVFSLLKRGNIVTSIKGSQGGYQLAQAPHQITVYDVLSSVESSLFETTEDTLSKKVPELEAAMKNTVFDSLDRSMKQTLQGISLYDLVLQTEKYRTDQGLMFFI